jgi:hypothetical protein
MTFVVNAETGQFLYLIMFILSCFTCFKLQEMLDMVSALL